MRLCLRWTRKPQKGSEHSRRNGVPLIDDSSELPNFLVIGAGKAGTTTLHSWLAAHPQILVPRLKETNFFAYVARVDGDVDFECKPEDFPIRSWASYRALFRDAERFRAIGEVSPRYLAVPGIANHIAQHLPRVRLIAILRHPVDRAYSSYLMHCRDGRETRTFEVAIREELDRTTNPKLTYGQQHYLGIGYYFRHLSRYWEHFDATQLHIELYDDLLSNPAEFVRRVYRFLGVDEDFEVNLSTRLNPSGVPRNRLFAPILRKSRVSQAVRARLPEVFRQPAQRIFDGWRATQLVKPLLNHELRARLVDCYRSDICRLEQQIGRDLSAWMRVKSDKP